MLSPLILLFLILGLAAAALYLLRRAFESRHKRQRDALREPRCPCGYILRGMAVPRCPECGRAVGFDKTFEELGIHPDELRDNPPH